MKAVLIVVIIFLVYFLLTNLLAGRHAKEAREAGEAFMIQNATEEGVITTESGLQYKVLQAGTGSVHPKATDVVEVHYHGTLIDGTVFDSSVERGEPTKFPLNRVISGWTEGLQYMVEGEKVRFFIPADLAYGNRRAGSIKPGSTLIFDVELLKINP
uniref:FKBP-type peptidyl-prolyl cis-trans isomerase n=1 Tax=Thaumasiovibrio occultus TaxID=1891184 RepID=UPI000B35240D|nr:FKBP-type peptidyl-prolyl cis-trans isomerase [Thaumasiovibrio occultus]